MADAGLDADVILDIRAALRQVGNLEEALDRAVSNARVTVDARAVTVAIDAAVHNADTDVAILGDAAALTADVTAAVDAADASVSVTGDASELTGDVTAAIDAADSNVVVTGDATELTGDVTAAVDAGDSHVVITGDSSGAQSAVRALGTETSVAAGSADRLKQALAAVSVAAVAAGLFAAATAASDLGESTSKATAVFGESTPVVQQFAREAAQGLGLSEQAALEAAGTFGNLFQALGTTQEVAADLSPRIITLAGDLASFNNLGVDETLEKLRSGLVGEIEPLRSLGISFGAAEVEARALELGLADVGGEISEGAKLQARYSLIAEQSSIATGDFERTSEGLANQQRILTAEFQNAVAAAGQQLLPTLLDLVTVARDDLIPGFSELAGSVFPSLASIIADLAPLLGITLDLLIALAPVFEVIASVVSAIPAPVIAMVGAMIAFKQVANLTAATRSFELLGGAVAKATGLMGRMTGLGPLGAKVALGVAVVGAAAAGTEDGLGGMAGSIIKLGDSFTGFGEGRASRVSDELAELTAGYDLSNLDETQVAIGVLNEELAGLGDNAGRLFSLGSVNIFSSNAAADAQERVDQLREMRDELEGVSKAELDAGVQTGRWTEEQVLAAEVASHYAGETSQVVGALQRLTVAEAEAAAEAEAVIEQYQGMADGFIDTGEALGRVRDASPEVATAIRDLRTGGEATSAEFLRFAQALDGATLSEEQMGDVAALVGGDLASLEGFVSTVTDSLNGFVDTAVGALPTAASVFSDLAGTLAGLEVPAQVGAQALTDALNLSAVSLEGFRSNLARISEAGFADLAALIAQQGPELGGALSGELVAALESGNTQILENLSAANTSFNEQWTSTTEFFRTTLGPEFILTTGLVGAAAAAAFGENLTFQERIEIAAGLAATGLDTAGQAIAAIAAAEGAEAARAYGNALGLDDESVEAAVAAGEALLGNAPTGAASAAGDRTGSAYGDSTRRAVSSRQEGIASAALTGLQGLQGRASGAGQEVGGTFGSGMKLGVDGSIRQVERAAANLVDQAKNAAKSRARAESPSRLFAELGVNLGEGVAVGLAESEALVARQAAALIDAAATAVSTGAMPTVVVDAELAARSRAEIGAGGGVNVAIGAGAVQVSFTGSVSKEEATIVGQGVADGLADQLRRRQLGVELRGLVP